MDSATTETSTRRERGLFAPRYFWTTVGAFALVFLGAFEALAVTTIMPAISRELNGESLYSVAFSGPLAASVIGMVLAGRWSDRRGPSAALVVATSVFAIGLLVSGVAATMEVFVAGRILQGLGAGAINVALYVIVARIFPPAMHPAIFGLFAAAWVLPSLVGPPVAGIIADTSSWRWVFLAVVVLVVAAAAAVVPALRQLRAGAAAATPAAPNRWGIPASVVVAIGVLACSVGGSAGGAWALPAAALSLALIVVAIRPLVPAGTLVAAPGLPATVLVRGAVAAAFFATEVYLPYVLIERYDLPTWLAGLILTVGAVSWSIGSGVQSRLGTRIAHHRIIRIGSGFLLLGLAVQFASATLTLHPIVAAGGWLVAGWGMGLLFPRVSTVVLGHSSEKDQGFNSAAMSITDAVGGATGIAFAGLIFTSGTTDNPFASVFALTTVLAAASVAVAFRVRAAGRD